MIRKATIQDAVTLARLAMKMWPYHTEEELAKDFQEILASERSAIFLMETEKESVPRAIGFAQCQLRYDYVEGTDSSPVGYLEGIFVEEEYRRRGYARKLLVSCEAWAREMGCTEFASDCELGNKTSLAFHLRMGFAEANRIICFTKKF
ncbi:MAG: GNAT family N-acetyltransferase [Lachnospiraceae bacterium]|nr:GNAT family N-acetyltransferase [Lachnospiraceae bacterium]